jgi:hypothetical protein
VASGVAPGQGLCRLAFQEAAEHILSAAAMVVSQKGGSREGGAVSSMSWQVANAFDSAHCCHCIRTTRRVGLKSLVLIPILCLNKNGLAKACLPVPLDSQSLRLAPWPSPALVGQPSLGRVAFSRPLMPYGEASIATNFPPVLCPATACRAFIPPPHHRDR